MSYRVPGVYVQELSAFPKRIRPVGTGAALLVGSLPSVLRAKAVAEGKAIAVESAAGFRKQFLAQDPREAGEDVPALLSAVDGYFANGGSALWVALVPSDTQVLRLADLPATDDLPAVLQIAAPGFTDADSHQVLIDACASVTGRFAILDVPAEPVPVAELAKAHADGGLRPAPVASGRAALYAPWLSVRDSLSRDGRAVPASGHVCGAIARQDADRGVHVAPANLVLQGVAGLSRSFSNQEQAVLNPAGVNAIRSINGGIRIWGARTLAAADEAEWRYIPVRRLADMILLSVEQGLAAVARETNSASTRATVGRLVGDFMRGLWEQGMLQGRTPEDAFFVRCDESNNSTADEQAGRLHLEMGIAAMRPAEFIVLRHGLTTGH